MAKKSLIILILLVGSTFAVFGGGASEEISEVLANITYTDAEAREILSAAGIGVNNPAPATSLEGIRIPAIVTILTLKAASGAEIVVTGGTESGGDHAPDTYSHANGYKIDLQLNPTLTNYIETNYTPDGTVGDYPAYRDASGNLYVLEGDHWDVTISE